MLRLFLNICLFISVCFFPWWITIGFILLLLATARAYEVIFCGFIIDLLYGVPVPGFMNVPFLFTLLSGFLFLIVELIKPHLVFYER